MLKYEVIQIIRENYSLFYKWYDTSDDGDFEKPQKEGKWSPGQHLEHIRKTTKAMNKALQIPRLVLWYKFGKTDRMEQSYTQLKEIYLTATSAGFKSPASFYPKSISNKEKFALLSRVRMEEEKLVVAISKCQESFLSKYLLPHPVFKKLTIREMLIFIAFHTDHHRNTLTKYARP